MKYLSPGLGTVMLPLLALWAIVTLASTLFLVLFLVVDEWQVRREKSAKRTVGAPSTATAAMAPRRPTGARRQQAA